MAGMPRADGIIYIRKEEPWRSFKWRRGPAGADIFVTWDFLHTINRSFWGVCGVPRLACGDPRWEGGQGVLPHLYSGPRLANGLFCFLNKQFLVTQFSRLLTQHIYKDSQMTVSYISKWTLLYLPKNWTLNVQKSETCMFNRFFK